MHHDDIVLSKFRIALNNHGISIDSMDDAGLIHISKGAIRLEVNLDNIRRDFERDQDESYIDDLVQTIVEYTIELPDRWEDVKNDIFISVVSVDSEYSNSIHLPVTDMFNKVYTCYDRKKFSWISNEDLEKWKVSKKDLADHADKNGDNLADNASIVIDEIDGHRLGCIDTEFESLKGALLFSSQMKKKISIEMGFPFYAVIPVRDFCYFFSQNDLDFFSTRLGSTVVNEYQNSGYPVTTEILEFTNEGVTAIGRYPID